VGKFNKNLLEKTFCAFRACGRVLQNTPLQNKKMPASFFG
jgi:hypothetical protein